MKPRVVQLLLGDDPPTARLYYGKAVLEALQELPEGSVHMVCTSPPYWGLRDYGVPPQEWPGMSFAPMSGLPEIVMEAQEVEFGLEPDPNHYIGHLVAIFREVRRVLRPDGTAWLNLGDSYVSHSQNRSNPEANTGKHKGTSAGTARNLVGVAPGLKPKDLSGIPWRAAFALQADGWYLRNDNIWAKPSCMPEPVTDRCTRSHEYVFLLAHPDSKGQYFYDADAIREPHKADSIARVNRGHHREGHKWEEGPGNQTLANDLTHALHENGRNKRTVWNVNPKPYPGAHFAVWAPELVEPMVKAGTSEQGVCGVCGAPYRRITERVGKPSTVEARREAAELNRERGLVAEGPTAAIKNASMQYGNALRSSEGVRYETRGWEPTCECGAGKARAVVMDIFSGSGTTGMVALGLDRDYVGIDLNGDYLKLAEARVRGERAPQPPDENEEGDIFDFFGGDDA